MSLRGDLIKLAHANPETRKHLLPLLKKEGGSDTFRGRLHDMFNGFQQDITNALAKLVNKDGFKLVQSGMMTNGFDYGRARDHLYRIFFNLVDPGGHPFFMVDVQNLADRRKQTFSTRDITDMTPEKVAQWIWKNVPASFKQ